MVKGILDQYEAVSGQMINYNKSSLIFNSNMTKRIRIEVSAIFQIPDVSNQGKYLVGLSVLIGRKKKSFWT